MAELQAERAHFIRKSELLGPRPYTADAVGRDARLDQLDSLVEPFARSPVGVVLDRRRAAHVEGAVIAGAIAHERLQDIEKGLIARPQHAVSEIVGMRVAALTRDGVDGLHVVGAVLVEELVHIGNDVVLPHAGLQLLVDEVIGTVHHSGGATMSTPIGRSATPASRISEAISSAWRFIRPKAGLTVPRRPISPALQFSGDNHGV